MLSESLEISIMHQIFDGAKITCVGGGGDCYLKPRSCVKLLLLQFSKVLILHFFLCFDVLLF